MFEKVTLENGLTVILIKISQVRSVSIGVWIKAGVVNENSCPNGIAHFLEHMLFKGTKNRTARQIAKEIEDIGGEINAFTSKEYTCYYTRSLDEYAGKCLGILSDIYFKSLFDEVEISKEKNVIKQEISMHEDTPDELIHDLIISAMWSKSPYGMPISGTKSSIDKISRENIISYHKDLYTADNTVISIAGNFDRDELLEKIEGSFIFENMKSKGSDFKEIIYTPSVKHRKKDTEQNHICIGYKGFDIFDDRNYDIACFNSLFGSGMSSLLFQRIREEAGLVYSVFSYNTSSTRSGSLIIYAGLDKNNTKTYFDEVDDVIREFNERWISSDELEIVKNRLRSSYILALESPSALMNYAGSSQIMKGYIYTPDELSDKIEGITLESMYSSVREVMENKRSIVLIGRYEGSLSDHV